MLAALWRIYDMKRVIVALLLLASLASTIVVTSAQEALSAGTVEGTLDNGTATYQLAAEEGDVFFLLLSSPDFDTYVEVLTNQGDSIVTDDDSGMGSNSALLFVAPASGTFDVVVRAYSGDASGAYTLTLIDEIPAVTAGAPVDLDVDGTTSAVFSFEAAGDPVDIIVDSDGKVDTSLTVIDSEGNIVDSSDDAINSDPALLPILLDAGVYYLVISPYSEAAVGAATLSITAAESRALGAEPTVFNFGVGANEEIATVDVEEGKLYRFEVTVAEMGDFNLNLSAVDPDLYTYGYFSFTNGLGGSYLYRADVTGTLQVQLSAGYMVMESEKPVEYTITFAEVVEE
jgi:hypothetical protein